MLEEDKKERESYENMTMEMFVVKAHRDVV